MEATESLFSRVSTRANLIDSLLCVGLDPHPELLNDPSATAARDFCVRIIESTAEHACAFKPNSAFFEVFAAAGWSVLADVIAHIPDEIPVILDAKRGDIPSTSLHYAQSAFATLGADAVTVSPYLGLDSISPFISNAERGIFLLCKTSNPGSADIQLFGSDESPLYMEVARLATEWNSADNVGLVVGATDTKALADVRSIAPDLWILAPGVGPQGGHLEAALESGLRSDGLGMLVPSSRSIATASDPASEADRLKANINRVRESLPSSSATVEHVRALNTQLAALADRILEAGCVKFGDFELKSGQRSPIYFDLRLLSGDPGLLSQAATAFLPILNQLTYDRLAAVPYAGLPIATAISLQTARPMIYPRKESKQYGTKSLIEGGYHTGETVVLIDDLITTGGSKLEAAEKLRESGLQVRDVLVLIDRADGEKDLLERNGLKLHAVFELSHLLEHWRHSGDIDEASYQALSKLTP